MADFWFRGTTGNTYYPHFVNDDPDSADFGKWRDVANGAWDAFVEADWADYVDDGGANDVTLVEQGTSGWFFGTWPTGITSATPVAVTVYEQAGGSPASTDDDQAHGEFGPSQAGLTTASENAVADAVLTRDVSNVEATAGEHTLCYVVLAQTEFTLAGTTLTVKQTDGSTTFATKTITADSTANPITSIT